MLRARALLALSFALIALAGAPAAAQEREQPTASGPSARPVHVGAVAGLAFPRPIAAEVMVCVERRAILGVEYSALPAITIAGIRTTLWGVAGDARVFPFHAPFFVGLRAGMQHLGASGSASFPSTGPVAASLTATTWYLNPRVGVLWTFDSGITLGLDAGVQVPVATSESRTTAGLANVPPQVVDDGFARVTSVSDPIVRGVLPTFDLLQFGYTY
jgi:hypothetical protein